MITYYYICAENCISQSVLQLNEQKSYFHMKFLNKYFRFRKHREKIVNSNDIKIQGDVDFHPKFPSSPAITTQEVYGDCQDNKNSFKGIEYPTGAFLPMSLAYNCLSNSDYPSTSSRIMPPLEPLPNQIVSTTSGFGPEMATFEHQNFYPTDVKNNIKFDLL